MLKINEVLIVTQEEKQGVLKSFNVTEKQFIERKEKLIEWIKQSEHLPKKPESSHVQGALLNVKLNLEAAKNFIENYHRCKCAYKDLFFEDLVPTSTRYKESKRLAIHAFTRHLTPDYARVHIYKVMDPENSGKSAFEYFTIDFMMVAVRGTYDFYSSTHMIFDYENLTWKIMAMATGQFMLMMRDIFTSMHLRISGFHLLNCPPLLQNIVFVVKSVLPPKLRERVYVHKDYESLQMIVPKESLPEDYGGTDKSLKNLSDDLYEAFDQLEPYFNDLRDAYSTKKYNFSEFQAYNLGFGTDGSFTQLKNID